MTPKFDQPKHGPQSTESNVGDQLVDQALTPVYDQAKMAEDKGSVTFSLTEAPGDQTINTPSENDDDKMCLNTDRRDGTPADISPSRADMKAAIARYEEPEEPKKPQTPSAPVAPTKNEKSWGKRLAVVGAAAGLVVALVYDNPRETSKLEIKSNSEQIDKSPMFKNGKPIDHSSNNLSDSQTPPR